ncbi:hypothetical protein Dsin_025926 [Dipteronia sinensis]|uniref:Uncharacterized protein n=1 Tax=Dipteronia sinensis TaxID=43782 RepID=A0AAD9ZXB8_9ROSI|nr:hypothetical protein Dsin_025926 [Dipteronia sinensis]
MELDSIECVPSLDLTDEDEIQHHHHQFPSLTKPHNNNSNNNTSVSSANQPGTTSVHELLECPVCTNSMYPPIHQVCSFLQSGKWVYSFLSQLFCYYLLCFYELFFLLDS